jgi:hypothetical protein
MFKKLLSWFRPAATQETVTEILTPPAPAAVPSVAATLKKAVDDQITDAVTVAPKKNNRRRKPKARQVQTNQSK